MLMHGLLLDAAERTPAAEAFHWVDRGRGETYADAVASMGGVAAGLHEVGVRPGDRVSIVAHNGLDYLHAMFACWRLGAISAHVSVQFADEFEYYLGDHDPTAIVFTHDVGDAISRAAPTLPSLRALICMDGPREGALGLAELAEAGLTVPPMATDSSAIAHLSYSSGTTGPPKGACLQHEPTVTATRCIGERLRLRADDASLAPGSMASSNPLVATILPEVAVGATVNVMADWTPSSGYTAVKDRGITLLAASPAVLQQVYTEAVKDVQRAADLRLRVALAGGGSVPPRLRAAWTADLGIALVESYGQSELGGFVALGFPEPRPADDLTQRVGPALPDKEVRILDDDGSALPVGHLGEICLRGASAGGGFMRGYWGRPEKTAETLRDGWLHTGDLGVIDANGWITLRGRRSEVIEHGGQTWFPRDVEEALLELPEVAAAALVGVDRPVEASQGAAPTARIPVVAVLPGGDDVDGFDVARARAHLASSTAYDVAELAVVVLPEFPMTPSGKIAKAALAVRLGGAA